jgi:hypothetical protein
VDYCETILGISFITYCWRVEWGQRSIISFHYFRCYVQGNAVSWIGMSPPWWPSSH